MKLSGRLRLTDINPVVTRAREAARRKRQPEIDKLLAPVRSTIIKAYAEAWPESDMAVLRKYFLTDAVGDEAVSVFNAKTDLWDTLRVRIDCDHPQNKHLSFYTGGVPQQAARNDIRIVLIPEHHDAGRAALEILAEIHREGKAATLFCNGGAGQRPLWAEVRERWPEIVSDLERLPA